MNTNAVALSTNIYFISSIGAMNIKRQKKKNEPFIIFILWNEKYLFAFINIFMFDEYNAKDIGKIKIIIRCYLTSNIRKDMLKIY